MTSSVAHPYEVHLGLPVGVAAKHALESMGSGLRWKKVIRTAHGNQVTVVGPSHGVDGRLELMGTAKGESWLSITEYVRRISERMRFSGSRLEIEIVLDEESRWDRLGEDGFGPIEDLDAVSVLGSTWVKVNATPFEGHVSVDLVETATIQNVESALAGAEYFELTEFDGGTRKGVATFVGGTAQEVTHGVVKLAWQLADSGFHVRDSCVEAVVGCWKPETR